MKQFIITLLIVAFAGGIKAQNMEAVFTAMPDSYIPQLESAWRKDLIDLFKSGKDARLKNTMNGFSTLKALTEDYMMLQVTERSTIEMKLLPAAKKTKVICLVKTIFGPVGDSEVSFYTTDWAPLATAELFTPIAAEWFLNEKADKSSNAYQDVLSCLDIDLIEYRLSPEKQTLTAVYNTPQYLSKEEREKVLPFLKKDLKVFKWKKQQFK